MQNTFVYENVDSKQYEDFIKVLETITVPLHLKITEPEINEQDEEYTDLEWSFGQTDALLVVIATFGGGLSSPLITIRIYNDFENEESYFHLRDLVKLEPYQTEFVIKEFNEVSAKLKDYVEKIEKAKQLAIRLRTSVVLVHEFLHYVQVIKEKIKDTTPNEQILTKETPGVILSFTWTGQRVLLIVSMSGSETEDPKYRIDVLNRSTLYPIFTLGDLNQIDEDLINLATEVFQKQDVIENEL